MSSTISEADLLSSPPDVDLGALGAWRQTLDGSAQAYAREVERAVRSSLGALTDFDEGWQVICRAVLEGRATEMQAIRDRFLNSYENRRRLLEQARDLAQFAQQVSQRVLPQVGHLSDEAEALERKLKKLSTRWQSAEDLEDLAAESLAPSVEKLEAVRRQYGYPQAWYDDDSKPF